MDTSKRSSKLLSLIKQVQSSTEEMLTRRPSISSPGPSGSSNFFTSNNSTHQPHQQTQSNSQQLDLSSAIEYNHYLINSYLEERNTRELPLYQRIISDVNSEDKEAVSQCEQNIIDEIRKDFFLQSNEDESEEDSESDSDISKNSTPKEELTNGDVVVANVGDEIKICDEISKDQVDSNDQSIIQPNQTDANLELSAKQPDDLRSEFEATTTTITSTDEENVIKPHFPSPNPELSSKLFLSQSEIMEHCVLNNLPEFSTTSEIFEDKESLNSAALKCDTFLRYLNEEKARLTKQVTIVSKRLSDMIVDNEDQFGAELKRVNQIDGSLKSAIGICGNGRHSLFLSRRDFTSTSLSIVENYTRRESIVEVIKSLQNIKTIRSTIDHIKSLLELDKNFPSAIRLYHETSEILEQMASHYDCVKEMKSKLVEMLLLAEEQMDHALAKMPTNFDVQTYQQLVSAYKQISKSDGSIHQLMMHFTNTIHDRAFSVVLGYAQLFSELASVNSSTPIKSRKPRLDPGMSFDQISPSELKRKPFTELCQYLKAESFLSCLSDLCRTMWDIMQNYYRVLCFYKSRERLKSSGLAEEDVQFAITKLEHGALQVWSDIQHKIRTLVSSVKFVEVNSTKSVQDSEPTPIDSQDQLLFSFEEFIKILTVCEKMIEIGEEFCSLYQGGGTSPQHSVTLELQNMLYQQTRAYFQSYHQVSMAELRIFLENETWTRCPVETLDEFSLIASLQEFSFIKNRLLKLRIRNGKDSNLCPSNNNQKPSKSMTSPKSSTSSFLLSPLTKSKDYFASYFTDQEDYLEEEEEQDPDNLKGSSPFDDILSLVINHSMYDDEIEVIEENSRDFKDNISQEGPEIATTNTALNVVRLTGRYMHIMFLLRPISHDVIKALMELFDYYFFTVYRFFAVDALNTTWLSTCILNVAQSSAISIESLAPIVPSPGNVNHFSQISSELRSFIRRINDTLILNDSTSNLNTSSSSSSVHNLSQPQLPSSIDPSSPQSPIPPISSPKRLVKYPPPILPDYVPINQSLYLYALPERIMAIESLIFIARQFYNLCPFLLDILRNDEHQLETKQTPQLNESSTEATKKLPQQQQQQTEDGFKLLQFYHDEMCLSVESLIYQCLFAVSTKLLPYETIIVGMGATKWDLKEIPSIHSKYVDHFVQEIKKFDEKYRELLASRDLDFMIPSCSVVSLNKSQVPNGISSESMPLEESLPTPLTQLELLAKRINPLLWECITRISNRCFVEGFASAKKCTNEGRALMQLDYQQFLLNMEKMITPYFGGTDSLRQAKALLTSEKEFVEEYVKAYYLTEAIFIDWIRQRHEYTTKQIVSLVGCIAGDNRKLKSSLLAAIDTSNSNLLGNETNNSLNMSNLN